MNKNIDWTSADLAAISLIILSIAIHVWWIQYTNATAEDAFITFRFARQIAMGNGFVYNPGEPVYGTTTPLLTLLLSAWLAFISTDVVFGARVLNIASTAATLVYGWLTLRHLKRSAAEQVFVLAVLLSSSKLTSMNTQGMEIPLGLSLLAMSWHAWVRGKTNLAGLLCGVLLWVRIDFVFWVLILASVAGASGIKHALRIAGIAAVVYLPWVLFAIFYFGSAIPFTITAKWVAYSQFNRTPYSAHLQAIFVYLSPFLIEGGFCFFWAFMVFGIAAWGMWINRFSPQKAFIIFGMFIVFEITRLTVTRVTFFNRYLVPIYWATMILFGVGLGTLWERIKTTGLPKLLFSISILMLLTIQTLTGVFHAWSVKEGQFVTNESSLKRMGLWLKYNTDPQSVVLLEPLGYVGYYSERKMLDVVGLVTPSVVELKRRRIGEGQYLSIFQPDYFIVHCDDAIQILPKSPARPNYQPAAMFDPLHFNEGASDSPNLGRSSCYEIWAKEQ